MNSHEKWMQKKNKRNIWDYTFWCPSLSILLHIYTTWLYICYLSDSKKYFFFVCFIFGKKKEWKEEVWLSCWAIKTRMENFRDLPDVWNWIFYIAMGVFISFFHFFIPIFQWMSLEMIWDDDKQPSNIPINQGSSVAILL